MPRRRPPGAPLPRLEHTAGGEPAPRLEVRVLGLDEVRGSVRLALFDSEDAYLEDAVRSAVVPVTRAELLWSVEVPAGDYALAAFHDENGNGRNDRNALGIPSEPYGFSNGARALFGPPRWEKTRFRVAGERTRVEVE